MTIGKARAILLYIFIFFFLFIILLIIIPYIKGDYGGDSLINLIIKVLVVYSIHFGVIAGGIFGQEISDRRLSSLVPFKLALVMVLIWNILLTWRCIVFTFIETDTTDKELANYIDTIAPASSFLVSGALAYFFASQR
ncbi:hypothetical protein VF14_03075 [Nostoc linckia z18]|uniref:Uncharacterized protein n=2 Tax=Nostoc linckia TaxID=92942 RepID=A0A9Q5ZGP5_NOSLI|nr:hypothetical protein [Nostoc linckia]PHK42364.1 hypothetical protein VF12_03090 [Nostoc linckia z15]PHK46805.1 hypothetical protein VF13_08960 [Nostoc linckia z16]PHJ69134.1 hypothetical protein VF02_00545 [Nostoc linckia z1]PHJ73285.1 hypothetical protein VF05_01560 [Nostoc linckia z3]PHJ78632.1 hypothetical protein VF03_00545 [Nostoc linckia z2]